MNHYRTSDGQSITKATIDRNVHKAKEKKLRRQLDDAGYYFCEDCARFGCPDNVDEAELRRLDCSHDISVDECQKSGKSELAWSLENITIRCRHHHKIKDKSGLNFSKK